MTSYADWVVETSTTTGPGPYNLSGAPPAGTSFFTFRQRFANGEDEIVYWVVSADRTKWEKNRGGLLTYGTPDTLTRNVVDSTDGGSAISWVGGDTPLRSWGPRLPLAGSFTPPRRLATRRLVPRARTPTPRICSFSFGTASPMLKPLCLAAEAPTRLPTSRHTRH
jgi:hypothetical protein